MRFAVYVVTSCILTAGVIAYAFHLKSQFYPSVVYLMTSKFCILTMGNLAFAWTLVFGKITKKMFLGSLREAEVELLIENSRYAVTETCLALTIFREELNYRLIATFTALLFCKIFHWLAESRVEYMEQSDSTPWLTHVRVVALMWTLLLVDAAATSAATALLLEDGPSVLMLFGFEFSILLISGVSTNLRYALMLAEQRVEFNRASCVFLLELVTEVVRLVLYLGFFCAVFTHYGVPLHIVRDLWSSVRKLHHRLTTFFRYRRLSADMQARFPEATQEQIEASDGTCIVCRDSLERAVRLPCGHLFHFDCLRMWLQRQQTCPTCRDPIPATAAAAAAQQQQRQQQQQQQQPPQAQAPEQEQEHQPPQHPQQQQQQEEEAQQGLPAPAPAAAVPVPAAAAVGVAAPVPAAAAVGVAAPVPAAAAVGAAAPVPAHGLPSTPHAPATTHVAAVPAPASPAAAAASPAVPALSPWQQQLLYQQQLILQQQQQQILGLGLGSGVGGLVHGVPLQPQQQQPPPQQLAAGGLHHRIGALQAQLQHLRDVQQQQQQQSRQQQ